MVRDRDHRQVSAHAALRPDAGLLAEVGAAAGRGDRARRSGRSCTSAPFAGWAARSASSCSTTCARACSRRTSTTPRSIRSIATSSPTTASSRCRAACGDPDRKGKVEAGVGHAQKTPLKGLRFETLEEAQAYLDRWEARWADTRIHGTTKRQVAAMFAEEQPALGAAAGRTVSLLPLRRAHRPSRWLRRSRGRVLRRAARAGSGSASRCSGTTRSSACWRRRPASCCASICARRAAGIASTTTDRPARTPPSTAGAARARDDRRPAHQRGLRRTSTSTTARAGVRRILGVLALAKKHGPAVVDDAAKAALDLGVPTYRFLRRYLERRPPAPLTLRQVDPLIRQLTLYRDLIDRKTGDPR